MRKLYFSLGLFLLVFLFNTALSAQANRVAIAERPDGQVLTVDGTPMLITGMNWDYFPIGTNFNYSLWKQSDDVVRAALDAEMGLLQNMGVNSIRVYTGIPPKWITYIYERFGIYTMLNHSFGRYGLTINGAWVLNTDYADPATKALLLDEITTLADSYKDTPGLLLYLIGNENNYGLFWDGAETEDIPVEDRRSTARARAMYRLMNEAAQRIKATDTAHPVAICNGDLLFLDLVAEHCPDVDIYGTNMYRGISFRDAFTKVKEVYGKPLLFTEFGADAFDAIANDENQGAQAQYLVANWQEIYANAAGLGGAGNSIGGYTFQFSDGWWKYKQTEDLSVHNGTASWANGGYAFDFEEGENNMNEEWFGICAKGATNERGLYTLYPRAAYYTLKEAHRFSPYADGATPAALEAHFAGVDVQEAILRARGDEAALELARSGKIRLSRLSAELSTYSTGGALIATPEDAVPGANQFPNELGFDHMQSYFVGVEANPTANLRAEVQVNVLGNVAQNPINEIFYENRGRLVNVESDNGPVTLADINRVAVYGADVDWSTEHFDLDGFYRTGHYHWGYEGDFFGLYPEANYGPVIDTYNGTAPLGVEIDGKKKFKDFSLAMGPELWWGANPAVLLKYGHDFGPVRLTGIFHEDLEQRGATESSFAIPMPKTRRATLVAKTTLGGVGVEAGGIWGGEPLEGRKYQTVRDEGDGQQLMQGTIRDKDQWGGKLKLTYARGPVNWYAQGAALGLVANGGGDYTTTYTGWRLRGSSAGNQYNFLTGFTYLLGDLQIAPNFQWQRPIEGPIPGDIGGPGRPRNILSDPFVVRGYNREMTAGEILFTYDPTPATWLYAWDSDRSEDAPFAFSAGFVFRHFPTTQDAAIGILPDGRTLFAFPGAAPAADLWEAHARIVSKVSPELGWIANLYTGTGQANGSDPRKIRRTGGDLRLIYQKYMVTLGYKNNDWGPYDYHRDFNLTFPHQALVDLSLHLAKPDWFALPATKLGILGMFRTLDEFSPRYCPTQTTVAGERVCAPTAIGFDDGNEWEIRTYLHINIFQ